MRFKLSQRDTTLFHCFIVSLLVLLSLTGCGTLVDGGQPATGRLPGFRQVKGDTGQGEMSPFVGEAGVLGVEGQRVEDGAGSRDGEEERVGGVDKETVIFSLDIDGEMFKVEMSALEEITVYEVLKEYVEKEGINLKTKQYDFGIFIEGIGDKVGDVNSFWLFYVNDKLAPVSADKMKIEPGDVVRFEFMSN